MIINRTYQEEEIAGFRVRNFGEPSLVEQQQSSEENLLEALIGFRDEPATRQVAQRQQDTLFQRVYQRAEEATQLQLPEPTRVRQARQRSSSPYRRLFLQEQTRRSERALLEEEKR